MKKEYSKKVLLPYLKQVKANLEYPEDQMFLMIMDIFKGQNNYVILDLCQKYFCQIVIVPHNLTNRLQPLDVTVNKPT